MLEKRTYNPNRDFKIKFEDLHPKIKEIIGESAYGEHDHENTLKGDRRSRADYEYMSGFGAAIFAAQGIKSGNIAVAGVAAPAGAIGLMLRESAVNLIKRKYQEIISTMNKYGVIDSSAEKNYPKGWLNPTVIANTHPIFHIDQQGNMIFHKETKTEFKRYLFQSKHNRSIWRWRGYLRPPLAPEKSRSFSKDILEATRRRIKAIKPQRVRQPI